jgi:hypothetical protein
VSPALPSSLVRFLGWNYGQTFGGPAYLQRFSRPYGGGAPSIPRAPIVKAPASATPFATSAVDLNTPGSLPGFAFHPTLPAGYLPTSVATGDFNKDGKMDWVVSNGGDNSLWLYLGNGDGTNQLPVIIPCNGSAPLQVIAADLRKIGVLDLVVAEVDSQTVGLFLGNGDGTFAPEVTYFVPRPPLSLAVGDFNGDGKQDIVVGLLGDEFSGPLATLLGDGTGKFGPPITFLADNVNIGSFVTTQIIAADLNGDGLTDLVLVDQAGIDTEFGAHSFLSQGDGTFKDLGSFGDIAVALGDMDEDGCLDAVTVGPVGLVSIAKGFCDGTFNTVGTFEIGAGEELASVALADMNGDGHLDVVAAGAFFGPGGVFGQEATNLVTVLHGDGHGSLGLPHIYRSEPSMFGLALADLNGDGHPDVIVASLDTDTASVFLNDGHGGLPGPAGEYIGYQDSAGSFGALNAPSTDFFVRDIDGDGKPDLALIESEQFTGSPWELTVMLNDGTGHFGPAIRSPIVNPPNVPFGYAMADFRNSGRPDFLTYEFNPITETQPTVLLAPNLGQGKFGPPVTTPINPSLISEFAILAAGDFNGDGKQDFILAARAPSGANMQVTVFLGNGDGTFQQGVTQTFATGASLASNASIIFTGDFNHDGKLDVLVGVFDNQEGTLNHNVYELLGNGDGTFQPSKTVFQNFGSFTVADLNHDGLPDIVEYIEPLNTLPDGQPYGFNIYLCQPDGSFQLTNSYRPYPGLFSSGYQFDNGSPQQSLSPMVADFNGDGNVDIAAFQFQANSTSYLQILAGNGDGTFTPTYAITPFHKFGVPRTAADVTGDGRADLIEVDGLVSSFHVIPSIPGPALQLSLPVQPIIGPNGTLIVSQTLISNTASNITLSASDANITIQPTVTIPAGSLSVSVPFTIGAGFKPSQVFSLTAQLGTQTAVIYSHQTTTVFSGFTIFSAFKKQIVPPSGSTSKNAIGIVSYGGYTTTAQFSCQGLPVGVSCQFAQPSVGVQPGVGGNSSLVVQAGSSTPLGSYTFNVVATDGVVTSTVPLKLLVADFNVTFSPASVTVVSGNPATFNLAVGAIGGWIDGVTLGCQVSPSTSIFCPIAGDIISPGSGPVTVSTNQVPPGDYTFLVSALADGVTHNSPPAVLHVQGVSGTISANSATIPVGSSANFNLALHSQNGLTDQFTFTCPGLPAGVSCSFNPASGTLPVNGALNTVLTVSVTSRPASTVPLLGHSRRGPRWLVPAGLILVALLLVTAGLRPVAGEPRRQALAAPLAVILVLIAVSLSACGGGGGSSSGPQITPTPTPTPIPTPTPSAKVVTVTVQASSSSVTTNMGFITVTIP